MPATQISPPAASLRPRKRRRVRRPLPLDDFRGTPWWKRASDLVGASVLLVLLSPVMLGIALAIRLVSPGPALFVQTRIGARGKPFKMYKFRSMHVGADTGQHAEHLLRAIRSGGKTGKVDARGRLIPGGALLRRCSLDELPQLFNVLRGEMSLVGPRPDVLDPSHYEPWAQRRFQVLPGCTGLWQVNGKNHLSWDEMLRLDVAYARRRSPWLDFSILLRTAPMLLGRNSA